MHKYIANEGVFATPNEKIDLIKAIRYTQSMRILNS